MYFFFFFPCLLAKIMRLHSIQVWQVHRAKPGDNQTGPWSEAPGGEAVFCACVIFQPVRPCGGRRPYHFLCGPLLRFIGIVSQCCHALIVPFWRPTTMPTRNVVLSEHQQDFVETLVQSGRYL